MTRGIGATMIAFALLANTVVDAQALIGGQTWWACSGYFPLWCGGGVTPQDVPASTTPPRDAPTGGVQLDIDPRRAEVYVEGRYVGLISDFSGYYKHLELTAGPHHIMIIARDYEPLIIPVMVAPGRTLPIRGTLARAHGR